MKYFKKILRTSFILLFMLSIVMSSTSIAQAAEKRFSVTVPGETYQGDLVRIASLYLPMNASVTVVFDSQPEGVVLQITDNNYSGWFFQDYIDRINFGILSISKLGNLAGTVYFDLGNVSYNSATVSGRIIY